MRSMTGYGRGSAQIDGRQMTVELKSVNHRFLDIAFRMPRSLSFLEEEESSQAVMPNARAVPSARAVKVRIVFFMVKISLFLLKRGLRFSFTPIQQRKIKICWKK